MAHSDNNLTDVCSVPGCYLPAPELKPKDFPQRVLCHHHWASTDRVSGKINYKAEPWNGFPDIRPEHAQ